MTMNKIKTLKLETSNLFSNYFRLFFCNLIVADSNSTDFPIDSRWLSIFWPYAINLLHILEIFLFFSLLVSGNFSFLSSPIKAIVDKTWNKNWFIVTAFQSKNSFRSKSVITSHTRFPLNITKTTFFFPSLFLYARRVLWDA